MRIAMSPSPIIASVCLAAGLALGRLLPRRRVRGEAATEFDMDPRLLQGKHWVSAWECQIARALVLCGFAAAAAAATATAWRGPDCEGVRLCSIATAVIATTATAWRSRKRGLESGNALPPPPLPPPPRAPVSTRRRSATCPCAGCCGATTPTTHVGWY